jgi:D-galactarolactone isomerase
MNGSNWCDAHIHIYRPNCRQWRDTDAAIENSDLHSYLRLQARLGLERVVLVQPLLYGTDNSLMLDAIRVLGTGKAAGVAIVASDVTDRELTALHEQGVKGIRFFVGTLTNRDLPADLTIKQMRRLDARLADLGLHMQINTHGRILERHWREFLGFRSRLVFDHMGHIPGGNAACGLNALCELLACDTVWVKISGCYLDSATGAPGYDDMQEIAAKIIGAAPERSVWGSNWPHPTVKKADPIPDDAFILGLLAPYSGSVQVHHAILAANPARLYQFDAVPPARG